MRTAFRTGAVLGGLLAFATSLLGCDPDWLGELDVVAPADDAPPNEPAPPATVQLALPGAAALEVVGDELMLQLGPDDAENLAFLAEIGGVVIETDEASGYARVRLVGELDLPAALAAVAASEVVGDAAPNATVEGAARRDAIEGPWSDLLWQTAGLDDDAEAPLDWTTAWRLQPRADGILVAVLDSGLAYADHEDETGRYVAVPDLACTRVLPGRDHINDDAFPGDDHQHGTHIAMLIAADPECGARTQGYAPGVTLLPIKVLDENLRGSEVALVKGIHEAVDAGAQIINMSLTMGPGYYPSPLLERALQRAHDAGVLMFAAAGNYGGLPVAWPAASPLVMAVGAHRFESYPEVVRTDYSQHGAALDVLAPGGAMHLDNNDDGVPDGVVAQTIGFQDPTRHGHFMAAGTSQATAAATGLAALMLAAGVSAEDVPGMLHRGGSKDQFGTSDGTGALRPGEALAQALGSDPSPLPRYSVELVGGMELMPNNGRFGCAFVRVLDENLRPAPDIRVLGRWRGAREARQACWTEADGTCQVWSPRFNSDPERGSSITFVVQALVPWDADTNEPLRPRGFYQMPRAQAEAIRTWSAGRVGGTAARSVANTAEARALTGCGTMIPKTYMIQNLSRAGATNPSVVLLDAAAMRTIDPSFSAQPLEGGAAGDGARHGNDVFVTPYDPDWALNFGPEGELDADAWVFNDPSAVWSPAGDDFWEVWGSGLWGSGRGTLWLSPSPSAFQFYGFGASAEAAAEVAEGAVAPGVGATEVIAE